MFTPGPAQQKHGLTFGPFRERWVHLCVDMQRLFAEATPWQTPWMPRVLPAVTHVVELGPERTIFTRFVPAVHPGAASGAWKRYWSRWSEMTLDELDAELVDLVPQLSHFAPPARLLDKKVYSPWLGTTLHADLMLAGVDTLIVTGAETEVCVLATVIGAIDLGYRVILVPDAICSSADPTHDAMLEIYNSRFGMQVETATVAQLQAARLDGLF